jgi:hypothetical protein
MTYGIIDNLLLRLFKPLSPTMNYSYLKYLRTTVVTRPSRAMGITSVNKSMGLWI